MSTKTKSKKKPPLGAFTDGDGNVRVDLFPLVTPNAWAEMSPGELRLYRDFLAAKVKDGKSHLSELEELEAELLSRELRAERQDAAARGQEIAAQIEADAEAEAAAAEKLAAQREAAAALVRVAGQVQETTAVLEESVVEFLRIAKNDLGTDYGRLRSDLSHYVLWRLGLLLRPEVTPPRHQQRNPVAERVEHRLTNAGLLGDEDEPAGGDTPLVPQAEVNEDVPTVASNEDAEGASDE